MTFSIFALNTRDVTKFPLNRYAEGSYTPAFKDVIVRLTPSS